MIRQLAALALSGVTLFVPQQATPAFSRTIVIERTHVGESEVDRRTFSVEVSETKDLRSREQVEVTWSGAHPTGGVVADPNIELAQRQEYPVVIMQCRGIDSEGSVPAGQRLSPHTCWTHTPMERYQQDYNSEFPAWRLDRHAPEDERGAIVGAPDPNPCQSEPLSARYVPFVAASGEVFYGGANGCAGIPPEGVTVQEDGAPPSNTTYGATNSDGTGQATFVINTTQTNASLGCSNTVPCALVIIPIMGISCDTTPSPADAPRCKNVGMYKPAELYSTDITKAGGLAVAGALWWSKSNWRNRITVPLTFAPPSNACDILDTRKPVDLYGSELMNQAMTQWSPTFCRDPKRFKFRHVRTSEPLAKTVLAEGSISAALVSRPPSDGYAVPTVNAPMAITGFAVTYNIDGENRKPYTKLRLNPRLLAKLMSESYWASIPLRNDYAALGASNPYRMMAKNPQDMSRDPEFIKLNPGVGSTPATYAASTLLTLSGNSDLIYALTSYINADPDARAFLDGKPDPWGMRVHPRYKGITLPRDYWPLLDDFLSADIDLDGCLRNERRDLVPVPILPLVAAPMSNLTAIAQAMQFSLANSNTKCKPRISTGGEVVGGTLKPQGRQQPGFRFMLGVTSLGDSALYGLRPAALQSSPGNYVLPSDASLRAAVKLAVADEKTKSWRLSYSTLRSGSGRAAYPGMMVVYAAVPTTKLDSGVATNLAQLIRFAASDGQKPGFGDGKLPPGYLPMTGALAAYALKAAEAVGAQRGIVPNINGSTPTAPRPNPGGGPGPANPPGASPAPAISPWAPPVDQVRGFTPALVSASGSWTLPVTVVIGLGAALLGLILRRRSS